MQATRRAARAVLSVRPPLQALTCHRQGAAWSRSAWHAHRLPPGAAVGRHARLHVAAAARSPSTPEQQAARIRDREAAQAARIAAGLETEAAQGEAKRAGKRKVAIFLGYQGTGYRGLQMQTLSAPEATIEDRLEEAIFQAGGILESNRGKLSKVSWSRSSRTDKGVHSLATVVGMKMEIDPDGFEADPEGLQMAAAINSALPPEVRVFSIQRVSKSWNARSECIRRCYRYYLPASALGLKLDGGQEDQQRLLLLQQAWERFQGTHPFHNYTKRRLYRDTSVFNGSGGGGGRGGSRGQVRRRAGNREGEEGEVAEEEDEVEEEAEGEKEQQQLEQLEQLASSNGATSSTGVMAAAGVAAGGAAASGAAGQDVSASGDSPAAAAAAASSSSTVGGGGIEGQQHPVKPKGMVQLAWKGVRDSADPINKRHFRFIEWCKADIEVQPLVPGGEPCVQLSLQGANFMLHQIRHMVGMAVSVARGHFPPELVEASLATPARMNLPLAPAGTLVLMGAQFSPFKRSWSGAPASAAQWTGDILQLKEEGTAAQQHFLQQRMLPGLDVLLAGGEWVQWEQDLDKMWYDEVQLAELLAVHASWREYRQEAKVHSILEEAAAAAENADET